MSYGFFLFVSVYEKSLWLAHIEIYNYFVIIEKTIYIVIV